MILIGIGEEVQEGLYDIRRVSYAYEPEEIDNETTFEVGDHLPGIERHPNNDLILLVPYFDINKKRIVVIEQERELSAMEDMERKINLAASILETPDFVLSDTKRIRNMTLEEIKSVKIEQLKTNCTKAIHDGFMSQSLKVSFGLNENDQMNFTQQLLLVVSAQGMYDNIIQWKALNGDIVSIKADQFVILVREAEIHKREQQNKYWTLESKVKTSETKEEVLNLNW